MSEGNRSGKPTLAERMGDLYRRHPELATSLAVGPLALGLVGCSSPDEPPKPENTVNTQAAGDNKLGDGEKAPQVDDPCASTEQEDGEVSQVGYDDRADDEATHGGESLAQAIENVDEEKCTFDDLNMFIPAPDNPDAIASLAQTDRFVPTEEQRLGLIKQATEPLPFVGEVADPDEIIQQAAKAINVFMLAASDEEAEQILVNIFGDPDSWSEGTQQRVDKLWAMRAGVRQAFNSTAGWNEDDFYRIGNSDEKVPMTWKILLEPVKETPDGGYYLVPQATNIGEILGARGLEKSYFTTNDGSKEVTLWVTTVPGPEGANLTFETGPPPSELLDDSAR